MGDMHGHVFCLRVLTMVVQPSFILQEVLGKVTHSEVLVYLATIEVLVYATGLRSIIS